MSNAVLARILLRYIAGYLVLSNLLDAQTGKTIITDPDVLTLVEVAIGAVMAVGTEFYYRLAKRYGWST